MGAQATVLAGQRFGRLTVLEEADGPRGRRHFRCRCDCGGEKVVRAGRLKESPGTRSCGCLNREHMARIGSRIPHNRSHGLSQSATYQTWCDMRKRCGKPTHPAYRHYGGRGIIVCDRWAKFENFLADMGEKPGDLTLDRIDNDGSYEPSNCRWATRREQAQNRGHNAGRR